MKVVLERVSEAKVVVKHEVVGAIGKGLMILVGFTHGDNEEKIKKMVHKISNMRIFEDENGKMNRSILDVTGSILSISQFTLYANTENGRRPSFEKQLPFEEAKKCYQLFNFELRNQNIPVEEGIFGEHMEVDHINDGPVTILLED